MFVLKRGNEYCRYLGGRLVEAKDYPNTGFFIVLGALWTKDLQEARTYSNRMISLNEDPSSFLANVRERYGAEVEMVKVKLVEVEHE